jgi:phosphoribosylformylglycinamidine cyclo-ligase
MCVVVPAAEAEKAVAVLKEAGEDAYIMGEIVASDEKVTIC